LKEEHRDWWCGKCRRGYVEREGQWVPCWCLRRNLFFERLVSAGVPDGTEIVPLTSIPESILELKRTRNDIVTLMDEMDREFTGKIVMLSGTYRYLVALSWFAHLMARGKGGLVVSLEDITTHLMSHRDLWTRERQQTILVIPFGREMAGSDLSVRMLIHLCRERAHTGFLTFLVRDCPDNEIASRYRTKDENLRKVEEGEFYKLYKTFTSIPTSELHQWVGKSSYEECKMVVRWNLNA